MRRRPATLGKPEMWAIRVCPSSIRCRTASVPPRWLSLARTSTWGRSRSRPRPPTATVGILLATSMRAGDMGIDPASTSPSIPRSRNDQLKVSSSIRSMPPSPSRMCLPAACSSGVRPSSMSANQGWRMSFSSTPTVCDCRSARNRAAALGRYPSSATARMTASRLAGLTFGELRSTSDTSDFDTPARAATVSRVGRLPFRPVGATAPVPSQSLERSNAMGTSGACQRGLRTHAASWAASLVRPGQAEHVLGEVVEHHLLRDRGDAHQPRFAPVALDVVLLRVAEPAVGLEGSVGGLETGLGGEELGQISLLPRGQAVVDAPGRLPDGEFGRAEPCVRLGERERDALVLADRAAEDGPGLGVGDRAAQRGAAGAEGFGSDQDTFGVQAVEQVAEAPALLPHPVAGVDVQAVVGDLAGCDGIAAELGDRPDRDRRVFEGSDEQGQPVGALRALLDGGGAGQ